MEEMDKLHRFITEEDLSNDNVVFDLSLPSTNWGQLALDLPDAWQHTKGEDIVVAVIDTGGPDHIDINDNILQRLDVTGDGPEDRAGHGCIMGEDLIWTSEDGIIDIESFYKKADYHHLLIDIDKNSEVKSLFHQNILTISYDNEKLIKTKINAVHKLVYQGELFRIKTYNSNITLTPWHPIYIKKENKIITIKACDLKLKDNLVIGNMVKPKSIKTQKVLSINKYEYDGPLYDLTVNNNANYLSNNILVSNTHVSGIIAAIENNIGITGVAPRCKLITIKVLNDKGMGSFSNIAKGLYVCTQIPVDIINMSLGTATKPPEEIHNLVKQLTDSGKIIIAAAGNNPGESVNYPAAYNEVIAVAPMDENKNIANFATMGPKIALAAPGVDIYSLYLKNGYKMMSGSSQAAPFFSGIVALLLSYARKNPKNLTIKSYLDVLKLLDALCSEKTNDDLSGRLKGCKFGIPSFANYMPWKTNHGKN